MSSVKWSDDDELIVGADSLEGTTMAMAVWDALEEAEEVSDAPGHDVDASNGDLDLGEEDDDVHGCNRKTSAGMAFESEERASALASCRRALEEQAYPPYPLSGMLGRKEVYNAFSSPKFASAVFRLFDRDNSGHVWIDDVTANIRESFQGSSDGNGAQFCTLFESGLKLAAGDFTDGRASPADLEKTLKTPELSNIAFDLMNKDSKGRVAVDEVIRFVQNMSAEGTRQQISHDDLNKFAETFRRCAGSKEYLVREDFAKMVSSKNKLFIDRAFAVMDRQKDGRVVVDEYTETLAQLAGKNADAAIEFLFRIYDINEDGTLELGELKEVLKASIAESGMTFDDQDFDALTQALWEDAGPTGNKERMTYSDLNKLLKKHRSLANDLADSITKWISPPQRGKSTKKGTGGVKSSAENIKDYLRANKTLVAFVTAFIAANAACFGVRAYEYRGWYQSDGTKPNYFLMFARANGLCLNLNTVLVLLLVMRYTITLLRRMGFVKVLPLDNHIFLHKMTGMVIFCQAWFHTAMHLCNFSINIVPTPEKFLSLNLNNLGVKTIGETGYNRPPGCTQTQPDPCEDNYSFWEWMFTSKPGLFGLMGGWANPTGVALILILTVMVVCSLPCVRRSGHFEVFYFTHLLYFAYFSILVLHAKTPWHWIIAPVIVFACGLLYRLFSMFTENRGRSVVTSGIVLPSNVTGLIIKRPHNFNFSPGDWVFIKIPEIAMFEWHPFTISSAPEKKDFFTLHIRGVGGWTKELYSYFEQEYRAQQEGQSHRSRKSVYHFARSVKKSLGRRMTVRDQIEDNFDETFPNDDEVEAVSHISNLRRKPSVVRYKRRAQVINGDPEAGEGIRMRGVVGKNAPQKETNLRNPLTIYIDGPFGAPASNVFRAQHAVLIATGIGVTPFASILQSIMCRFWESKKTCPNCSHKWNEDVNKLFRLKKVDFFWINRDQRSFEWFINLLSQLEIEQASEMSGAMERFLDMHMYMTSALQRTDMRAVGLELALDLLYEKEKRDLVTGLKSRTKAGRPNWDKVLNELKKQNKGQITVFYCGNPMVAQILRAKCRQFGFKFSKEVF